MKLPKRYDSDKAEEKWQKYWEKEEIYKFDPKSKKPVYSIDTPPPTVSGKMHIGHAYSYSQMDIIARYRRMAGYNVFYPFGTDDNGLPTERLIEKRKGIRHQDMDRDEFTKFCLKVLKEELRPEYIQEWKNIGISADYDLFYTTINEHCRRISQKSFVELYDKDRIYRKEDPTIWCPKCHMALAQVELEDKELESEFVDLVFKLEDGSNLIIATTRPELLSSCVAIFVHPEDEENKKLVGKKAVVPLFNQEVPILEDERVDKEKGTGVVMCCTFGDQTDIEWYRAHDLPLKMSITEDGKMSELAGKYEGLKIKEARKKIVKNLEEKGLIKNKKKITHTVNVHERCGTEIEILHTTQWFIKYLDLKNKLLKAGREMNWYPEHMINRYTNWIEGLQWDWCISRQRFFGVPIPVWYCKKCEEPVFPDKEKLPVDPLKDEPDKKCKCGSSDFEPEEDVLDTWATSSMTPQIAAELIPDRYDDIYPMSLRPQAHDIITFWLFNTVVKSHLHNEKNPFEDIMISGWALDPNGRKMSKSKGNVVDPKKMIEKYSVDALRFWAASSSLGEDLPFKEKDLATAEKFSNKMWNASKFALMHLENYEENEPDELRTVDKWMLSKLNNLIRSVTDSLEKYEYVQLKRQTEDFFWHDFCDNYLEIVKDRLYNPSKYELGKEPAQYVLYQIVLNSLKLMAPVMPYLTEEIYHLYFNELEGKKSIHISDWPEGRKNWIDNESEKAGDLLIQVLASIRQYKQEKGMSLGAELKAIYIEPEEKGNKELIEKIKLDLKGASRADKVKIGKGKGEKVETEAEVKLKIQE